MQKIFTLLLAVGLGIAVGVIAVGKNVYKPAVESSLEKQDAILQTLQRMEKNGDLASKVADVDARVSKIEDMIKAANPANRQAGAAGPQVDYNKKYDLPIEDSYLIGDKNAPATITAFVDFQCPFCTKFHAPIAQLLKDMPDKVNLVTKNFPLPFHPNARPAAKFAMAAGEQGKYAEVVDAIFANAQNLTEETFKKISGEIGLDWGKVQDALKNNDAKYEAIIAKDMKLGEDSGVMGTPSYYLNGKPTNARDLQTWKDAVEKAIAAK